MFQVLCVRLRRLAMLGFIAAISAEFASHKGLLQQYRMAPGPIAVVFLLFTVASLIPISKVRFCRGRRIIADFVRKLRMGPARVLPSLPAL